MPSAPLRPCAQPLCPELVEHGRCDSHRHAREHRREATRPAADRFYDTARWRRFRKLFLARHPVCEMAEVPEDCARAGRTTAATDVDHIVPLADGGLPLDVDNCRAACHACHSRRTARDTWRGGAAPARANADAHQGEGGVDLCKLTSSDRRLPLARVRTELGVFDHTAGGGAADRLAHGPVEVP